VQTIVAVARLVSTTAFGVLWFTIGRFDALLVVAVVLAPAVPLVALVLRPLISRPAVAEPLNSEAGTP
jgi:hypothetical protein